ncbi:MAG: ABC transporter permease [Acidobacteria bacterium]|nr:ABC transporter permease [Acidobacteriota bacterium]
MDHLWHDLRVAARGLRKDRGFALTTMATLALCLAANVAIFAVIDAVLLKPLPFDAPDELVALHNAYPGAGIQRSENGVPDYFDRLEALTLLDGLAAFRETGLTVGGDRGDAERLTGIVATPSFFTVLRVQPYRGRLFTEEESEPGRDQKLVLTYGYWQRTFAAADSAVGQSIRINGTPFTIVGVLPPDFRFIDPEVQMVRPVAFTAAERADDQRHSNNWEQIGRLKRGATTAQVQAQLDALNRANLDRFPELREVLVNAGFTTRVVPFHAFVVGDLSRTLQLLWAGALLVLVIGCVNVTNLVLVRATARRREMATRQALGAGVGRLVGQSLVESLLLAVCGGVAGLLLGWWALVSAPFFGLDQLPRGTEAAIDIRVVMFSLTLVTLVAAVMAVLPIVASRHADLAQAVREEGRSATASRTSRLARRALVTSQVAFALILLVGAGTMVASLQRVLARDPGFRGERVLTGLVNLPAARYAGDADLRTATDRLLVAVRALPGVEAAGVSTTIPFSGNSSDSVIIAEGYQMAPGESVISPNVVSVSDGYFETMGVTLVAGRWFTDGDVEGRQRVIVIDDRLARRFWPDGDAVGKRMYQTVDASSLLKPPPVDQMFTIVGVIAEMRLRGMVDGTGAERVGAYFMPYRQRPSRGFGVALRAHGDPSSLTEAARRAVASVDAELPLFDIRTMEQRTSESLVDRRTPTLLATGFAVVALLLAGVGIYGVLAYQVSQRRKELGVRMALGAGAGRIFALVLREGALIVGIGAAVGLLGAVALRRPLDRVLNEVGSVDTAVVIAVAAILLVVALLACVIPARRAARTDPAVALAE